MEKLLEILEDISPGIDYTEEKELIDSGLLDSFDVIMLVGELNEAFDIEIGVEHFLPENFNSAEDIMKLIKKLS